MGIDTPATSRMPEVRPNSNPDRSPFRMGSLVAQLENDRYVEGEGVDDSDRAARAGHNAIVNLAIGLLQNGWPLEPELVIVSEDHPTDQHLAAYCRGRNSGVRHVRELLRIDADHRANAALVDLRNALPVATVELHTAPELDDEARARRFDVATTDRSAS